MRGHIHLDPIGGIAGDMFVAAMLDAFPERHSEVTAALAAVLPQPLTVALTRKRSHGFAARHFALAGTPPEPAAPRRYPQFAALVEAAGLEAPAAAVALDILKRLAEAEAAVHGVALEDVHFHEIADWDTLADVVAAGVLIGDLKDHTFSVGTLPLGGGTIRSAHGPLPVPAPATAHLLKGFAFRNDGVAGERVTPTGAAILAALEPGPTRGGTLISTGLGAGTRDLPGIANVLRVLAFEEPDTAARPGGEFVGVLAFAVDDMTGEEIATAAQRLRGDPAVLDLSLTARIGKKGRPETLFECLVRPEAVERVADLCFHETATIGLRWRYEERRVLARTSESVHSADRDVRVKRVERPHGRPSAKAESDDLVAIDGLGARRAAARAAERAPGEEEG